MLARPFFFKKKDQQEMSFILSHLIHDASSHPREIAERGRGECSDSAKLKNIDQAVYDHHSRKS